MFGPIDYVVFDFDGTLVDTMTSVIDGLSYAIETVTGKKVSTAELIKTFGPSPDGVLDQWMEPTQVPEASRLWIEFESKIQPIEYAPFEGIPELLLALKNAPKKLAIFTGRDRKSCLKIAQAHGWMGKYFSEDLLLCGDDGLPTKPSGEGLAKHLKKLKFVPERTLMVGDHPYDMMAGRAAQTKTAAVLWDLPKGSETFRKKYREMWKKWDTTDCDLRLPQPKALSTWLGLGDPDPRLV